MRALLFAILLVGCSKKDHGPACPAIVDHMLDVTKQMLPGHDPADLGNRKQMIDECERRNYSVEIRKCLFAAKTLDELGGCRHDKPPPTAPAPTAPTGGAPPAPAGSGG